MFTHAACTCGASALRKTLGTHGISACFAARRQKSINEKKKKYKNIGKHENMA